MTEKFNKLYNNILAEAADPNKQIFTKSVTDFKPQTLDDEEKLLSHFKQQEIAFKKMNGVTRISKPMRDLKDELIKLRDNDVQVEVVEIEESINVDVPKMARAAKQIEDAIGDKRTGAPSPLEIEQFSIENDLKLTPEEVDYIHDDWDDFIAGKIK